MEKARGRADFDTQYAGAATEVQFPENEVLGNFGVELADNATLQALRRDHSAKPTCQD
jgi:hypothetical protein